MKTFVIATTAILTSTAAFAHTPNNGNNLTG